MASLSAMKHGVKHLDLGLGILGFGLNAGIGFGTGLGTGYLYGRYRSTKWGQHVPKMVAGAGKLGAVLTQVIAHSVPGGAGVASRLIAGALDTMGNSGLAVLGCEHGIEFGRKAAGMQAVLLPASEKAPANALPITRIGALSPAPSGEMLSLSDIESLCAMH